jgi:hypothetical protein
MTSLNPNAATVAERRHFNELIENRKHQQIDPSNGYLVKRSSNPIKNAAVAIQDTGKDVVNLTKALATGKSDDASLGRMNDIGLKVGGLAIAGFLASKAPTTAGKAMEFAGLGAFLGSMSLWPKLFIDKPVEKKFGFNPRQEYVDNGGRKKQFFLDNQFQPWDLYSSKELNKVGDKMGVAKDIHDREELIKEKMRATALQANTAWMWTAGIMTPVGAGLVASQVEKVTKNAVTDLGIKKAEKALANPAAAVAKKLAERGFDGNNAKQLSTILKEGNFAQAATAGKQTPFERIASIFNPLRITDKAMSADVGNAKLFQNIAGLEKGIASDMANLYRAGVDQTAVTETLSSIIGADNVKRLAGDGGIKAAMESRGMAFDTEGVSSLASRVLERGGKTLADADKSKIQSLFAADAKFAEVVGKAYKGADGMQGIKARVAVLADATNAIAGSKAESMLAREYNRVMKTAYKTLGNSGVKAAEVGAERLGEHVAGIVKNEKSYKKYLSNLSKRFINDGDKQFGAIQQGIANATGDLAQAASKLPVELGTIRDSLTTGSINGAFSAALNSGRDNVNGSVTRLAAQAMFENANAAGLVEAEIVPLARRFFAESNASTLANAEFVQNSGLLEKFKNTVLNGNSPIYENAATLLGGEAQAKTFRDGLQSVAGILDGTAKTSPALDYVKPGTSVGADLKKAGESLARDKKWLIGAGLIAAGVIACTLLLVRKFGKVKDEKYYTQKAEKQGGQA